MTYMVMLVVDDIQYSPAILNAWEEAGVRGVTILNSIGLGRLRRAGLLDDLPLMPSLHDLLKDNSEHPSNTLISVVESQELVDKMAAIAQQIIGDLEDARTGFMFVLPVVQTFGLGTHRNDRSGE